MLSNEQSQTPDPTSGSPAAGEQEVPDQRGALAQGGGSGVHSAAPNQSSVTSAYADHLDGALRWYARRAITVGGILGGIVSLVTLFIGYETLAEFRIQNQQLVEQNEFLREQSAQTQRATNASALSQLIKDIEREHDRLLLSDEEVVWKPSRPLQYRIASMSRVLTPYRVREEDPSDWSPERALLLRVLMDLNASASETPSATFQRADLRGVSFGRKDFSGIDLSGANLEGATFLRSRLDDVDLDGALLGDAKLINVSLKKTRFVGADLRNAAFWGSDLTSTNLDDAQLDYAILDESALPGVEGSPNIRRERQPRAAVDPGNGTSPAGLVVVREIEKTICDARSLAVAQLSTEAQAYVCSTCPDLFGPPEAYQPTDVRRCEGSKNINVPPKDEAQPAAEAALSSNGS